MDTEKMRFTWIPFYEELARKLLEYKDNRKALLDIVYGLDSKYVDYIHDDNNQHYIDLDPFSVFGIFNRSLKDQNRITLNTKLVGLCC